MQPATTERIQRMIDAEAAERFPPGAVPQLMLLRYGDHPVIEPGELYLGVILGQDGATRDAWMQEHHDRLGASGQHPTNVPLGSNGFQFGFKSGPSRGFPSP